MKSELSININELEELFDKLWPICRSITGEGISKSLDIINEYIPLNFVQVKSGTKVHDWTIPKEWNIYEAYIEDEDGNKIIDFKNNNLHIVSYSTPIDEWMCLTDLKVKLYSVPELPDAIPYVTSYYKHDWGFCISHNQLKELKDCRYHVVIKSTLKDGYLKYGECIIPSTNGNNEKVLLSSYICHPSMANNELSGPIAFIFLYKLISTLTTRKYNYHFYIGPETIGAISFLNNNKNSLIKNCIAGYVINCCGDKGKITYKKTRRQNSISDLCAINTISHSDQPFNIIEFFPEGSDERQYSSPGYNLPIGSIMRSMYGTYKEYHTSLDNKSFISFKSLAEIIDIYFKTIKSIEFNETYLNLFPYGEPMLAKSDLYNSIGDIRQSKEEKTLIMWILNLSDGNNSLADIALRSGSSIIELDKIAKKLLNKKIIKIK